MFGITWYEFFLFLHVLAAISFLGPVTVATSLFPKHATLADLNIAKLTHRVTKGYGYASILVLVFGLLTANEVNYLGEGWVNASLALFLAGIALLIGFIIPRQAAIVRDLDQGAEPAARQISPLEGASGFYSLIWLVILILMVAKPF